MTRKVAGFDTLPGLSHRVDTMSCRWYDHGMPTPNPTIKWTPNGEDFWNGPCGFVVQQNVQPVELNRHIHGAKIYNEPRTVVRLTGSIVQICSSPKTAKQWVKTHMRACAKAIGR